MKQRILTAIIGIIIVVPIILYGSWPFIVIAYLLATVALFELIRMFNPEKIMTYLFISSLFLWLLLFPNPEIAIGSFTLSKFDIIVSFAAVLLMLMVFSKNKLTFDHAGFLLLATLYIGTAFYYLMMTRFYGLNSFLFILFVIWGTDSGAYFIGRRFGKKKLWPAISPNKTIGGALGGISFGLLVAIIFQFVYPFDKSLFSILVIAIVISIVGQIGDLVASAIKRHYQVKDSGKIFPGHGGILDRLDSFLFVLLILHLIQFF